MKRHIKIVDTTLRDGEQCPGLVFSQEDKIRLALFLDSIGVYEIEAGIYDTATEGSDYIRTLTQKRKNSIISIWSRLNQDNMEEASRQKPDLIHISAPVSYAQIYNKIKKNKKWVENSIKECISIAKSYNIPVTVGFEDATRADMAFILNLISVIEDMGVETVRLADTVGVLTPVRASKMISEIKERTNINIEIHEHNDLGMAVANSIVMANAGADMVDVTLYGIGERAGNCNFYEFVQAAMRKYEFGIKTTDIRAAEHMLHDMITGGVLY